MEIINNIFSIKNVVIYLLAINVITFLTMLIDKKKAEKGHMLPFRGAYTFCCVGSGAFE